MLPSPFFSPLKDEFTFDSFVVGPSNRLPHAAAVAAAENPGGVYNPLFLHGSSGLGKTHILQAVCHRLRSTRQSAKVLYITCESFVNDFIQALQNNQLHIFRHKYRQSDLLAIDDIQFLKDKELSQQEFFHTFNSLFNTGRQMVLSSNIPPGEIPTLHDRLLSRFHCGLVTRLEPPTYETRVSILQQKARSHSQDISGDVIHFIASHLIHNIRELEGMIVKIIGLSSLSGRTIDLNLAKEVMSHNPYLHTESEKNENKVTIEDIIKEVSSHFHVRLSDLQSKRRSRSIAFPRQVCMHLARRLTPLSLKEIGGFLGGRDHTTVLYADEKMASLKEKDIELGERINEISHKIRFG